MNKYKSISATRVFNSRFTSTLSISLVLFILGIILSLGLLARDLSVYVKENICLSVVVDDAMKLPDAKMLQNKFEKSPWAKSVTYIDKETALKDLINELGENPADLLGYNPALASFEINLKANYANTDSMATVEKAIRQNKNVEDVIYRKDLIHMVNDNVKKITAVLFAVAILFTFISYSLLTNTVRLIIYSKRFLIRTMQLVGADKSFIRKPFMIENLWSGIIASIVAMGLLYGLLYYFEQKIGGVIQLINPEIIVFLFVTMLIFGILIMLISTYFAVNRYLRMNTNDLYYV